MKIHEIDDEVYQVDIFIVQGQWKDVSRWMEEEFAINVTDRSTQARGRCCFIIPGDASKRGSQALVLWFQPHVDITRVYDQGTVAHECFHGQQYLLRERGLRISEASEEAFAYYATWLYRKVAAKLLEWRTGAEVNGTYIEPAEVPTGAGAPGTA